MHKSSDAHAPTPFLFGPTTSPNAEHYLEAVLPQLMVNSFSCMNSCIKGLAQLMQESEASHTQFRKQACSNLDMIMAGNTEAQHADQKCLLSIHSKLDSLLQLTDATKRINKELLMAYHAWHVENTVLKAAIEDLMRKITEQTGTPTPPSPDIATYNPSAMEEMFLQILDVQCNIQYVLEVVRNPMGKSKCSPSNNYNYDDTEPMSPTAGQPTVTNHQHHMPWSPHRHS
jgi:hypothetical protein